jgi:hypothetical protein
MPGRRGCPDLRALGAADPAPGGNGETIRPPAARVGHRVMSATKKPNSIFRSRHDLV